MAEGLIGRTDVSERAHGVQLSIDGVYFRPMKVVSYKL